MFYGASSASVRDPFGHVWVLLSWKEDLEPAEMERRGNALLKPAQPQAQTQVQTQTQTQGRERTQARTVITVRSSEAKPYDRSVSPALMEIDLRETFSGDLQADSTVRALQTQRDDRSASMVSMQRVDGELGGRRGTFVFQGSQTVTDGKITATWFVVPRSGTGRLTGLRGEGGFEGEFGKGSVRNAELLVRMTKRPLSRADGPQPLPGIVDVILAVIPPAGQC